MVKQSDVWIKQKNGWTFLFYSILVIALTLISYKSLNNIFYSSDEWIGKGVVYNYGPLAGLQEISFIELLAGRSRPLASLLTGTFMYFFDFNITPFVVTAYAFHILNGILLFIFLKKISNSLFIAFIGGIFFITVSGAHQSITWFANITQDPIAVALVLTSQLFLIKFLEKSKKIYLFITIITAYIAFLFKDAYFYVFIWLPILYMLLSHRRYNIKNLVNRYWCFLIVLFGLINYKLVTFNGLSIISLKSSVLSYLIKAIFNWFYYPLISLSQAFIPAEYMFKSARKFLFFNYGNLPQFITNIDAISQNILSDLISLLLSFIFIIILCISFVLNKTQRKTIIMGLVFYFLSFSTVAVFLLDRNTSYVESRYLYAGMIGIGIFFATIIDTIKKCLFSTKIPRIISILFIVIVIALWYGKQITLTQREVNRSVIFSQNTKHVLFELSKIFPTLPNKPIIFLTGNSTYFGNENHFVPLGLNPGYIFMIWYYDTGVIPKELISGNRLWTFGQQWYKVFGKNGFGYFYDKKVLKELIVNKSVEKNQIVGLFYDGNTNSFKNITNDLYLELFDSK